VTRAAVVLALLLLLSVSAGAGDRSSAALDQALLDLSSDLRVVCVAALPGDEDWATLAWLRRSLGVETKVLLLTKGEGGQSETGSELNEDLAAVRARESIAAAKTVGADVEFLGFPDFGSTPSAEDALRIWGRKEVVRRLVRAVRASRPHIVIAPPSAPESHGQRAAAVSVLSEVQAAAADPEQFPEEGPVWSVDRVFASCSADVADIRVPIGKVDPVRGLSYAQMGQAALQAQPSLGPGMPRFDRDAGVRTYRIVVGPEDVAWRTFLTDLPVPRPEWRTETHRAGTREELLGRVLALKELPESERPPVAKIDRAAALAHGLQLILRPPERPVTFGEKVNVRVFLRNGGTRAVTRGEKKVALGPQSVAELPAIVVNPKGATTTVSKRVTVFLGAKGVPIQLSASTLVEARPELEVRVAPWGRLFRPATDPGDLEQEISRFWVEIDNHGDEAREEALSLRVEGTDRLKVVDPGRIEVPAGGRRWIRIELHALRGLSDGLYPVEVAWGPATVRDSLRVLDVRIVGSLNVGVVTTIGDDVVQFLRSVGIRPTLLTDQDLIERDLNYFNTIYLGIRAYHERPVLARVNRRLLEYVRGGGHLVVNYHRPEEWSSAFAPFPLELGSDRVDEEDARVTLEEPQHRLFTFPNRVQDRDFVGWRTERALWLPSSWDRRNFRVLLTSADRGAKASPVLLLARAGEGTYVYTSLTWFRQLRNLNPGAMKMIANVISYSWR